MQISTARRVSLFFSSLASLAIVGLFATHVSAAEVNPPAAPGRAAAHAALSDGADLPARPPQLPLQASDRARQTLANTAFGDKGAAAVSAAHAEAQSHAGADALDAHLDAASRAAQGSVAAAARNANADARMAAGQTRATSAKASAASRRIGGTPPPGGHP
jgi:hypothetical protein